MSKTPKECSSIRTYRSFIRETDTDKLNKDLDKEIIEEYPQKYTPLDGHKGESELDTL